MSAWAQTPNASDRQTAGIGFILADNNGRVQASAQEPFQWRTCLIRCDSALSMSALEPYRGKWNKTLAAHLLNRATFGPLPDEIDRVAAAGMDKAVAALLDFEKSDEDFSTPETPDTPE